MKDDRQEARDQKPEMFEYKNYCPGRGATLDKQTKNHFLQLNVKKTLQ